MKLEELEQKATATEACLIEAVKVALADQMRELVVKRTLDFINTHPIPPRDQFRFSPNAGKDWVAKLEEHLK